MTAFYSFLELRDWDPAELPTLVSEPYGRFAKVSVNLWSDAAVRDFETFLMTFMTPPPSGLRAPRRLDDLDYNEPHRAEPAAL